MAERKRPIGARSAAMSWLANAADPAEIAKKRKSRGGMGPAISTPHSAPVERCYGMQNFTVSPPRPDG